MTVCIFTMTVCPHTYSVTFTITLWAFHNHLCTLTVTSYVLTMTHSALTVCINFTMNVSSPQFVCPHDSLCFHRASVWPSQWLVRPSEWLHVLLTMTLCDLYNDIMCPHSDFCALMTTLCAYTRTLCGLTVTLCDLNDAVIPSNELCDYNSVSCTCILYDLNNDFVWDEQWCIDAHNDFMYPHNDYVWLHNECVSLQWLCDSQNYIVFSLKDTVLSLQWLCSPLQWQCVIFTMTVHGFHNEFLRLHDLCALKMRLCALIMNLCNLTMTRCDLYHDIIPSHWNLTVTLTMTVWCHSDCVWPHNDFVCPHNEFTCPYNGYVWLSQWLCNYHNVSIWPWQWLCVIQAMTLGVLTMILCHLHNDYMTSTLTLCDLDNDSVWSKQWLMPSQRGCEIITRFFVTFTMICVSSKMLWALTMTSQWLCAPSQCLRMT